MMNARGHLSSETIDLLLLSALEAGAANEAKAHLDECSSCKERWRELNEDKQRFEQFVFARTLPRIEERLARKSWLARLRLNVLVPALGVAAAAAVGLVVYGNGPGGQTEDDVYIGVKGNQPLFEVFARRGQGDAFEVQSGATLRPRDRIRFVVNPGGARYVLVASVDGRGTFTVYHPFGAAQSAQLEGSTPRRIELPNAVELDDTPGTEHLAAVFSDAPVQASDVEAALRKNPERPQLPGARVITWEFNKDAR